MREPLTTLAFFVAVSLVVSLAVYKLAVWVLSGIALGVGG